LKANLLYISSPGGVGFSVSKRGSLKSDDGISAEDNYKALIAFFNKFPNLKKNDFYITG
jgi:carboxypeptidase C (cathepsin A)